MITEVATAVSAFREVAQTLKTIKELLPDGGQKEVIGQRLEAAERSLALAESTTAKALGYELCRCTFPPQIMLTVNASRDSFRCGNCGSETGMGSTVARV